MHHGKNAKFSRHVVRCWRHRAERRSPHDKFFVAEPDEIGQVRMPPGKLFDRHQSPSLLRSVLFGQMPPHILFQRSNVQLFTGSYGSRVGDGGRHEGYGRVGDSEGGTSFRSMMADRSIAAAV